MEIKKQNGCTKEEKIKKQKEPKARCLERQSSISSSKAISLGKSVLTGKAQGFVYPIEEEEEE